MRIVIARYNEDIRWVLPFIKYVIVYNKGLDDLYYIPPEKIIKCENLGREGGTYIKHILDNYDSLDDYTIFLQGKITDHLNDTSENCVKFLISIIREQKSYNFKYISQWILPVKASELHTCGSGLQSFPFRAIPEISTDIIIKFINQYDLSVENKQKLLLLLSGKQTIKRHELIGLVDQCKINGADQIKNKLCSLYSHKVIFERIRAKFSNVYTYGSGALFISSKKSIERIPKDYWQEIYATLQHKNPSSGYGLEKMWRYLLT
jgi:hypothetical protein